MEYLAKNRFPFGKIVHLLVLTETHKGLKRATRVLCSWIFIFQTTIFGNPSLQSTHELWAEDGNILGKSAR